MKKILFLMLVLVLLVACDNNSNNTKKENINNSNNKTIETSKEEVDYRPFMMTITEKFVQKNFGIAKVSVKINDFTAIHTDEELKSLDGKIYKNTILATGNIEIGDNLYLYQIITDVDNLEEPNDYTVLNFETIRPQSDYYYNVLED